MHGAWHGDWCWDLLSPELEKLGHRAVAMDLPCEDWDAGLDDNAGAVTAALEDAEDDVILVGHSFGGITIPGHRPPAGVPLRVPLRLRARAGPEPRRDHRGRPGRVLRGVGADARVVHPDGSASWEVDAAVTALYHDCCDDVARWAASRLRRQVWTTTKEPCPLERWPDVPSSYILCKGDKSIAPDWSRRVARDRLGVEAIELPGGHSPMLSRPRHLAEVLAQLVGDR